MKRFKKFMLLTVMVALMAMLGGCMDATDVDRASTKEIGNTLSENQPTPTDMTYSLERFNLIRRAYEVNGEHGKAMEVEYPGKRPVGYVALLTSNGSVYAVFEVDGKVSSLNSYLTPDSSYYSSSSIVSWLPDVDGSYGENDTGIFFFTPEGKYHEWNLGYHYSTAKIELTTPTILNQGAN